MLKACLRCGLLILIFAGAANVSGQATGGQGLHRLSSPGKDWSVDVTLPNFDITVDEFSDVDTGYWFLAFLDTTDKAKRRHFVLQIRLEPAQVSGDAVEVRDFRGRKLKQAAAINPSSVKTFEYKRIPGIKYAMGIVSLAGGSSYPAPASMRSMDAFFVKDDVWITFSAMTPSLTKENEELFYTVLDSVKFTDTSHPSTSFDHYFKAKSLLHQKQYKQAAEHLTTALGLEQTQRQLDLAQWRSLIGHLLDIYTATGDHTRIRELLDYGVSLDPTFPLFHLALARHYASLGDMDATLAALEKAYQYRKHGRSTASRIAPAAFRLDPNAFWIDPLSHPAFASFKKNEKFRKAVKDMKK